MYYNKDCIYNNTINKEKVYKWLVYCLSYNGYIWVISYVANVFLSDLYQGEEFIKYKVPTVHVFVDIGLLFNSSLKVTLHLRVTGPSEWSINSLFVFSRKD